MDSSYTCKENHEKLFSPSTSSISSSSSISEMDANKEESSKGNSYFTWDTEMDKILGTTFIEQLSQGNKLDGRHAWKPAAWTAAIISINQHCGKVVSKQNVLSRLKTWEKHFEALSPLLLKSVLPFSWDYSKNRIQVHENSVWQDHVKVNPELVLYLKKEVENWDDICALFSQDYANGDGARTANEEEIDSEVDPIVEIETIGESANSEVHDDVIRHRQTTSTSSSSRGIKRKASDIQLLLSKAVSQMVDSLNNYFTMRSRKANANQVLDELRKVFKF